MRIWDYLREKLLFIIVSLAAATSVAFLLYTVEADYFFTFFIPGSFFFGILIALVPEYVVKNQYYRDWEDMLERLDKRYLASEIIEYPDFYEGQILHDTLKTAGKSMNDEIAKYKRSADEYREYIELWVHEIKTPIAGAELICENMGNDAALEELKKIENFVEQALFYSRSGDVEKDYIIKQIELSDLVHRLLRHNANYFITRKISVRLGDLSQTVFTDAKWLIFILRQFVDNSVKYGAKTLEFSCVRHENSVSLLMRDDGAGIPESDIDRIFDKGFTGENGRLYGRSTGLGLYLCKKLCVKLGLSLSASSRLGEGTVMEIVFPKNTL
jgi:signal transduction histidine kinase